MSKLYDIMLGHLIRSLISKNKHMRWESNKTYRHACIWYTSSVSKHLTDFSMFVCQCITLSIDISIFLHVEFIKIWYFESIYREELNETPACDYIFSYVKSQNTVKGVSMIVQKSKCRCIFFAFTGWARVWLPYYKGFIKNVLKSSTSL